MVLIGVAVINILIYFIHILLAKFLAFLELVLLQMRTTLRDLNLLQ